MNKLICFFLITLALIGCSEKDREKISNKIEHASQKINESYEESFKAGFSPAFLNSCVGENETEQHELFCQCVLDDLLSNFDSKELQDADNIAKYIEDVAVLKCSDD